MRALGKMDGFRIAGLLFLFVGVMANQWTLAALLAPDGVIESLLYRAFIWTFQGICILLGLLFLKYGPVFRLSRKAAIFSLIALAIGSTVGLVLGEISIRVFSSGYPSPEMVRSRSLQYVPCVFACHMFPRKEILADGWGETEWYVNEKGYRGPSFEATKAEGAIRLMFYGGSQVFNLGSGKGKDWPHRVGRQLRQAGFHNVEVINAGIPGHASFDCVGRLFAEGHTFDPDYVVLCAAWNDIKYFRQSEPLLRSMQPCNPSKDPRTNYTGGIDRFLCLHSQLWLALRDRYYRRVMRLGAEGRRPVGQYASAIEEEPTKQYRLSLEMFVDCARNIGAVPILMKQPRLVAMGNTEEQKERINYGFQLLTHEGLCQAFEKTDEIIDEVARAKGVVVIDASARMTGKDEWFKDHIHLTEEGGAELARITAEHMADVLGQSE